VCGKNPIFRHIKPNNSGTAKVKIVKNERDPPLFTNCISSLPVKRGGSLSFLTIFTFAIPELFGLDMTENRIFTLNVHV
jgi:hypothetical protein